MHRDVFKLVIRTYYQNEYGVRHEEQGDEALSDLMIGDDEMSTKGYRC